MTLDAKDHAIITRLVADGRTSNRDLAQHVGLSPSACHARVRRLEERRVIVGYRAVVALSGRGHPIEGWADVRFAQPPADVTTRFLELLRSAPEVVEAHRMSGNSDYLLRFCAGDFAAWNTFRTRVEALGCVTHVRLNILVEPLI